MRVLVVIDMQNDFIDQALGTKEAVGIVENVAKKIKEFDGPVQKIRTGKTTLIRRKERTFRSRTVSGGAKDGRSQPHFR